MLAHLLTFAGLALALVVIPGPAVTLVMKNAAFRGGRSALTTAVGVLVADLLWAAASVLGLTALLVASAPAFFAVKVLGALYLVFLGVRLILWRPDPEQPPGTATSSREPAPVGWRRASREGFLCDLSNPKTVLVYASVIPQFVSTGQSGAELAIYGVMFAFIGFLALAGYAAVFTSARSLVARPRAKKFFMRSSGGVLAVFGVGVAATASS